MIPRGYFGGSRWAHGEKCCGARQKESWCIDFIWQVRGDKSRILRGGTELTERNDYINECASGGDVDLGRCRLASADFRSLFPSVPHLDLIEKLSYLVHYLFDCRRAERGVNELRMKVPMFRGGLKFDMARTVKMAVRMIRHGCPREWIWRGLDSYRRLMPAKGKWSEIKVEIKRRVEVEWHRSPSKPS